MTDFELEGTMRIDNASRDLILNEFGYVRCFYCGSIIPPRNLFAEITNKGTGSMAIMCQKCFLKLVERKRKK